MKKNLMSIVALVLALASLVLSCAAMLRQPEEKSDLADSVEVAALITGLQQENLALQEQVNALSARIDLLESGSGGTYCNLLVDDWEVQDDTLVLTAALFQVQLPAGTAIDKAQLVLTHNGAEVARADILPEAGDAPGSYQIVLQDTWFILPELAEEDVLDIYPEVLLDSGLLLTSGSTSWYYTADGLFTAVG